MNNKNLQKAKLIFVFLLTLAGMTNAFAQEFGQEFIVDDLKYEICGNYYSVFRLKVTGFADNENAHEELVIPDTVFWNGKKGAVIRIQFYSFDNCTKLTSITIPNSVTDIGSAAFSGCTKLSSISIPNSVIHIGENAFTNTGWYNTQPNGILYLDNCCLGYKGNKPLGTLQIDNDTRLIADEAFYKCTDLTGSLIIPNKVISIGTRAFMGCSGFNGNLIIGQSVTKIGNQAFQDCTGIIGELTIPFSVTSIEAMAFKGCSGLTSAVIESQSLKKLSYGYLFGGCNNLSESNVIYRQPETTNVLTSEEFGNHQNLKQYKGKFEMSGFGNVIINTGIYSAKKNGFAQYEYREAADGTRIFEGDFYFATTEENLSSLMRKDIVSLLKNSTNYSSKNLIEAAAIMAPFALGKLKNDKQVGKWIWGYWADGMFVYKEITYDDYGNAKGPIKQYRYAINYGEFWHSASYRTLSFIYQPTGWLIGEFADNILVSADYRVGCEEVNRSYYNRTMDPFEVSGKFNRRGPVGRWTVRGGYFDEDGKFSVVEFDNNGTCIANYWIDQSTGDKKRPQKSDPLRYINRASEILYTMKELCSFRSTPK